MSSVKSARFTFTQGSSDKEYRIHIQSAKGGFHVIGENGRRGGTLTPQPKTTSPVSREEADKLFDKLVKERLKKGYVMEGKATEIAVVVKAKTATMVQLLKDCQDENQLEALLNNSNYIVQEKFNGERRTLDKKEGQIAGGNKKAETVGLPQIIIDSVASHMDIELDGEIIGETLYVFDLLRLNGKDIRKQPLIKRLETLNSLKFGSNIKVIKTAFTTAEKKKLLQDVKDANGEGIVIKEAAAQYNAGRDNSTAFKHKLYKTATIKVAAITKGKRSVQMQVMENGSFTEVGAVTIPVNQEVPSVGEYCEVRYLYAYKGGSLFQPTFLFKRDDVDDTDCGIQQLVYKAE